MHSRYRMCMSGPGARGNRVAAGPDRDFVAFFVLMGEGSSAVEAIARDGTVR